MKVEVDKYQWVKIISDDGGFLKSQSVEANLLYLILQELKTDRRGECD